jgi:hypothetical protein
MGRGRVTAGGVIGGDTVVGKIFRLEVGSTGLVAAIHGEMECTVTSDILYVEVCSVEV